jgi:pyrroline-5-carboxylate reductase
LYKGFIFVKLKVIIRTLGLNVKFSMHILIVGGGAMGSALYKAWQAHHTCTVIDPRHHAYLPSLNALGADYQPDVIILAVKPQIFEEAITPYAARFTQPSITWVSIAAGIPVNSLATLITTGTVVRTMPNLPITYGQGMTALFSPQGPAEHVTQLFNLCGQTCWIEAESDMDAVTAISGSGPAYVYAFVEALANAGIALGLEPTLAMHLARQTLVGAGTTLHCAPENPAELRRAVTSPEGATAAGLAVLMPPLEGLLQQTTAATSQRAQTLGSAIR